MIAPRRELLPNVWAIVGIPGSGKGEQCQRLAKYLNAAHFSSGELLRQEGRPDLVEIMEIGGLVPQEEFQRVLIEAFEGIPQDRNVVLEGPAKKADEAPWLVDMLAGFGRSLNAVIWLLVGDEVASARKTGRERFDDTLEAQRERHARFTEETLPSIQYFHNRDLVVEVNGEGTPDNVEKLIHHLLELQGLLLPAIVPS